MLNGVRHILWDIGLGFEIKNVTILATLLFYLLLFWVSFFLKLNEF